MKKNRWGVRQIFFALIALGVCTQAGAQDDAGNSWDARVITVSGSVNFYPANSSDKALVAVKGLPLEAGDKIVTNSGGKAQIALSGSGVIGLAPNSSFTVSSLEKPKTLFSLNFGNLIAKFDSLLSGETLQVQTPTAVAAIRGTEFGVGFSKKTGAQFGVFDEGKVEIKNQAGSEFLMPHQEISVLSKSGMLMTPHPLKHFLKYRSQMRVFHQRLAMVRLQWKKAGHRDVFRQPETNRREVREKFLRKMNRSRPEQEGRDRNRVRRGAFPRRERERENRERDGRRRPDDR